MKKFRSNKNSKTTNKHKIMNKVMNNKKFIIKMKNMKARKKKADMFLYN
jgi:hypothetical protein